MTPNELEKYAMHDVQYYQFGARASIQGSAWYLRNDELANYYDTNRALHLRDDGRGPVDICQEIVTHFASLRRRIVVDVDFIAEQQGFGRVLRSMSVLPAVGSYVAMRWAHEAFPPSTKSPWLIKELNSSGEADAWAQLAGCDELDPADRDFWCAVGRLEFQYTDIVKLGAFNSEGVIVGACSLFMVNDWARIDSVIVRPECRRKGAATSLIHYAVERATIAGSDVVYLNAHKDSSAHQLYSRLGFVVWATNPMRRHMAG